MLHDLPNLSPTELAPPVASILLVDDRPANLRALEAVLSLQGFKLVSVGSGRDALRELLAHDFALVILDVQMPELDGFETAVLMRQRPRNLTTPIIFLTALFNDPKQAALGYAAGAVDYICKPFDPAFLLAKVRVFADLYLRNEILKRQGELLAARDHELLESRHILEAHKQAAEMADAKVAFLATISHELRTPLHALMGWTQMLRSGRLCEEKRDAALAIIERNARKQAKLVDDLIDVAYLVTGTLVLDLQNVDLAALVCSEAEAIRSDFPGRRMCVQQSSPALMVRGDPARLRQVVHHLLENAVKFSEPNGAVDVSISGAGGRARVVVHDNGEGIAPSFLPHLFEPFRAGAVDKSRSGLAIGLALAKNMALLHDGDLIAESDGKGCGSTFTLELPGVIGDAMPAARVVAAAGAMASDLLPVAGGASPSFPAHESGKARAESPARGQGPLHGTRILVVEDEPDARELLCTLLEGEGALVAQAASAEEAMQRFAESRPDMLVSDIGLPGEDGCALMQRVRALGPERGGDLPAVAITGYSSSGDVLRVLRAGFDKHLSKPTEPDEVLGVLIAIRRGATLLSQSPSA